LSITRKSYKNITTKLLYEDFSYDESIKNGIAVLADVDIFEYKRVKMPAVTWSPKKGPKYCRHSILPNKKHSMFIE
jgi:hypothetical protein